MYDCIDSDYEWPLSSDECLSPVASCESEDCSSPTSQSDFTSDIDAFLGPECSSTASEPKLKTFKLVGDNIDKNVRPREMRVDHQTRSLHYFHVYAVRDRVDLTNFSSDIHLPDIGSIQLSNFLPSSQDETVLRSNFSILIGRILMKYIPFFEKFGQDCLERHIMHEYSEEMSKKSEVVCKPSFAQYFSIINYYYFHRFLLEFI